MEVTVEIVDRNYEQIKEFCDFNNIRIEDYIVQCAEDDYFTRKYGDLNEKLKPKEEVKEVKEEPKEEEQPKVEKKKVGRPKKKVEEKPPIVEEEKFIEEPKVETEQVFIRQEDTIDTTNKELVKEQKRTKRTLKIK